MTNKELLSPCGLYCGVCGVYYASHHKDQVLKEKLAKAYGDTPDKIECNGCMSDKVYWYCQVCPVKTCAADKKVEGCYQCGAFPCAKIDNFPVPEGKKNILRAVPSWRELGTDAWIEDEKKLFSCKKCGVTAFRGAKKCRDCGELL